MRKHEIDSDETIFLIKKVISCQNYMDVYIGIPTRSMMAGLTSARLYMISIQDGKTVNNGSETGWIIQNISLMIYILSESASAIDYRQGSNITVGAAFVTGELPTIGAYLIG